MENKETLQAYARELRLYNLTANLDRMIHEAQQSKPTYLEFITRVFAKEVECRRKPYLRICFETLCQVIMER